MCARKGRRATPSDARRIPFPCTFPAVVVPCSRLHSAPVMIELERTMVSRKTPGDGRLEIRPASGAQLRTVGAPLHVIVGDTAATATVEIMPCGCAKAAAGHAHIFLKAEPLRQLRPESMVSVSLDPDAMPPTVYITAAE